MLNKDRQMAVCSICECKEVMLQNIKKNHLRKEK